MKTIGLVGGVASGKSLAASMLADLGAGLLDADRAGHEVLATDATVQRAIRDRWGNEVFLPDGAVDRRAVAAKVFGEGDQAKENRTFLEELVHPRIRERLLAQLEGYRQAGRPAVVLDAALLFEAGWNSICDVVLFIDAPRDARQQRAAARGWTAAEFADREASQWPVERKRNAADAVISNHGSPAEFCNAIGEFWNRHILPQ